MLLGDTVTMVCTTPRNLTWFTRPFLLMRGWGLRRSLVFMPNWKILATPWDEAEMVWAMALLLR